MVVLVAAVPAILQPELGNHNNINEIRLQANAMADVERNPHAPGLFTAVSQRDHSRHVAHLVQAPTRMRSIRRNGSAAPHNN